MKSLSVTDEEKCDEAMKVVLDSIHLCRLLQGLSQSCVFTGYCSDLFTNIAMLHLCADEPSNSLPTRRFRSLLFEHKLNVDISEMSSSANEFSQETSSNKPAAPASPLTGSPLLQTLDDADRNDYAQSLSLAAMPSSLSLLEAKEDEIATLRQRIASLESSLAEAARRPADPASPPGGGARTAAASLLQNGVPIVPAGAVDLDFANGPKPLLGRGVYSEVWQSTMTVAVKALTGRFSQGRLQLFRQEAEALQLVQGAPGVIRFLGICLDAFPTLALVTEAAAGGTLEALLAAPGPPLPLARAAHLAGGVAAAMEHVHARGVAHRDLKPGNVVLTRQGDAVKLIDFGLARRVDRDSDPSPSRSAAGAGSAPESAGAADGAGTPAYQAPEALLRRPCGLAGDVYAFAILLWELRAGGRAPYQDLSLDEMAAAVVAGARPPIDLAWGRPWAILIEQCWHADPARRPPFAQVSVSACRILSTARAIRSAIITLRHDPCSCVH